MNWRRGLFRVWIVLSVVWMIAGSIYISGAIVDDAGKDAAQLEAFCKSSNERTLKADPTAPQRNCWDERTKIFDSHFKVVFGIPILGGALLAGVILEAVCLLGGMIYGVIAWVRRGFAQPHHA